ncbi:MAG TPA: nickel pincer cofactor biosynthesis protein LarC [Thermodesulfobacteriota bacterium]|nr:nickel pincer cofactor biosynthesis protein LarC [Thermodesulfobacteriota bacterium]
MSKIAYFDCFSGISGDMIVGALIDAGLDIRGLEAELDKLGLHGYRVVAEKVVKNGIAATKFNVITKEQIAHRHLEDLNSLVDRSRLNKEIKTQAKKIFLKIAEAEAKIHNRHIAEVHFHEIGAVDTVIDVVGVLVGLRQLGVENVYSSKLNVGSGFVEFSHGIFPVPAPATAEILKAIPIYATDSDAELVTPTGAAIIATLAQEFGYMPVMETKNIGYGAGTKDLKRPNVLRVFIGDLIGQTGSEENAICIIECNIDDMNPQLYDHVINKLLTNGALDVYLTSILMKKSRPGVKLTVLANIKDTNKLAGIIFEETTSIGIRIREEKRAVLEREIREIDTEYGRVKVKVSNLNGRVVNAMPEYEDCKRIANERDIPLKQVYRVIYACLGVVAEREADG